MQKVFTINKRLASSLLIYLLVCACSTSFAQTVSGIVTDSLSNPLPGTNILIKGTSIGTTTDANGAYIITSQEALSSNTIFVFSFIGFKTVEIPYNGNINIDVQLSEDNSMLNEVVVTALGI